MTTEEILPCPECGGVAEIGYVRDDPETRLFVTCRTGKCWRGPMVTEGTLAVNRWNGLVRKVLGSSTNGIPPTAPFSALEELEHIIRMSELEQRTYHLRAKAMVAQLLKERQTP